MTCPTQAVLSSRSTRHGTASIELAMFMPILVVLLCSFVYFGAWGGAAIRVRSMARIDFAKQAASYKSNTALVMDEIANTQDILTADGKKNVSRLGFFPARSTQGEFTAIADCWNYRSVPLDEFLNPTALKAIAGSPKSLVAGKLLSLFDKDFSKEDQNVTQEQAKIEADGKRVEEEEREKARQEQQAELDKRRDNVEKAQQELDERQTDIDKTLAKLKGDGKEIPPDLKAKIERYRKLREDSATKNITMLEQNQILEGIGKVDPVLRSSVEKMGTAAEKFKNNQFAEQELKKQISKNPI